VSTLRSALEWLIQPFMDERSTTLARAARIYAAILALAVLIVPYLVIQNGADGWLVHLTISALFFTPLGALALDSIYLAVSRVRPSAPETRRSARMPVARLGCLYVGVSLGLLLGYAFPLVVPLGPMPPLDVLVRDYGRNMRVVTVVLVTCAAMLGLFWYRTETYRLESAAARARFEGLRTQLQPHFLFNALGSLKELIVLDPAQASATTQALADLYRAILDASTHASVPLGDELRIVRAYLAIEQTRYGERLRVSVCEPSSELAGLHVPTMAVQLLTENAIKHGIMKARVGGEVRVEASRRADGRLEVVVLNTGAPYAPAPRAAGAPVPTGLANARARIELMYGALGELTVDALSGETRARIVVSGAPVGGAA
jgi:hypothetical protein